MNESRSPKGAGAADRIVADARRARAERERGYREQALKLFPWVCGRCGREFSGARLRELTVHHRNHDHDDNPPDGSNWELLCLYCHDNEHARQLDSAGRSDSAGRRPAGARHQPFAGLKDLLRSDDEDDTPR
ncbi:MAG TPA: YajD family HNH nuclease [Quisquiliibacterium sp.]|nr:YajD family HNH nuclease [Quisquiliibacterium sp.]